MIHRPAPRYHLSSSVILPLAGAWISGAKRSFGVDARRLLRGVCPPLRVWGKENIPLYGPGLITINHYWSPTFWAPWLPIAVSALVPGDVFWTMTDAFTYPGQRLGNIRRSLSHLLLTRIAAVYGFNTMPPMPPNPAEIADRARSVQRLIDYARSHPGALIGLAPEGYDRPGGILDLPPEGAGRLALILAGQDRQVYPVGAFEEDGEYQIRFGQPYHLAIKNTHDRKEADYQARVQITKAIAQCLPERLAGKFV
jgi:hypothetical protein